MIGLVQVGRQQMADRYTYFPLIGLFVAVVWLCAELFRKAFAARGCWHGDANDLAVLWAATFVQAGYWRDSVTLFATRRTVTRTIPWRPSSLGSTLLAEGRTPEAIALLEKAVRLARATPSRSLTWPSDSKRPAVWTRLKMSTARRWPSTTGTPVRAQLGANPLEEAGSRRPTPFPPRDRNR